MVHAPAYESADEGADGSCRIEDEEGMHPSIIGADFEKFNCQKVVTTFWYSAALFCDFSRAFEWEAILIPKFNRSGVSFFSLCVGKIGPRSVRNNDSGKEIQHR